MWTTSKTHTTQWNLLIQNLTTLDVFWKGSSLVWYLSTVKPKLLLANPVQHFPIPGFYSGIFAIYYLQHHGSQQSTDRANNTLFYALWALYALTTATIIVDMLHFWIGAVSMDDHACLTLFQSVVQNVDHLSIIDATLFALCDVTAQSILVRSTANSYHYSSDFLKDISLLDRLGLQHSCCDYSVILNIRMLTFIILSSFTLWF